MRRRLLLQLLDLDWQWHHFVYWCWCLAICIWQHPTPIGALPSDPTSSSSSWSLATGGGGGRRYLSPPGHFQHQPLAQQQQHQSSPLASVLQSASSRSSHQQQQTAGGGGGGTVAELCNDPRCSCSSASSSTSTTLGTSNVSCHCSPQDQEATLSVRPLSIPHDVSHLVIEGCRNVVFHEGGLRHLNQLSTLTIIDVGEVAFHSGAFNQAQVERDTTVTVGRCRQLVVKSNAFASHPLRPVAFYSSQCYVVRIDESAFSRGGLHRFVLADVHQLQLASNAFRFASGATGITSTALASDIRADISIQHATMTDLKSFTFPSPLHRLSFDNVTVTGAMESNATSALRIAQLVIANSRIGRMATGAFSELTHLDSIEMRTTYVHHVASRAFASAASSLSISGCDIGRLSHLAVCMPAARVHLRLNRVHTIATGALHLREWNELLIENNTVQVVERHAFYNIGEPKVVDSLKSASSRFVIRGNVFNQTQPGAFVISAQALRLQLQDNHFYQHCDCQMAAWTAELTQVNRLAQPTASAPLLSNSSSVDWINVDQLLSSQQQQQQENDNGGALWLGSSLFNASSCWMDEAAAQCSLTDGSPFFMTMNNYTLHFCSVTHQQQSQQVECVAAKRAALLKSSSKSGGKQETTASTEANGGGDGGVKPVGLSSVDQDLMLVVIWAVLAALVLLALLIGLVYRRRRSKARHHHPSSQLASVGGGQHKLEREDRITCSPLIPVGSCNAAAVEKQLGSGVVSSGSISRLSVKEYRHYLEELGPIYSEPIEPVELVQQMKQQQQQYQRSTTPPALPAIPFGWTTKSSGSNNEAHSKMTIDRGTQTLEAEEQSSHHHRPPTASLAQEFTDDLLAALRDKLDISPLYCEVRDSLQAQQPLLSHDEATVTAPSQNQVKKTLSESERELYDLIKVVDLQPKKPAPPTDVDHQSAENIYCKPWVMSQKKKDDDEEEVEGEIPKEQKPVSKISNGGGGGVAAVAISRPVSLSINRQSSTEERQTGSVGTKTKQQPFHIRASLPKWPPPSSSSSAAASAKSNGRSHNNALNGGGGLISPTKDTKPPWRSKSPQSPTAAAASPPHHQLVRKTSSLSTPSSAINKSTSPSKSPDRASSTSAVSPRNAAKSSSSSTRSNRSSVVAKASSTPHSSPSPPTTTTPAPNDESSQSDQQEQQVYAEVASAPFSFSFRRPLFNRAKSVSAESDTPAPKKPARIASPVSSPPPPTAAAVLCDQYADPRDLAITTTAAEQPLYSELMQQQL